MLDDGQDRVLGLQVVGQVNEHVIINGAQSERHQRGREPGEEVAGGIANVTCTSECQCLQFRRKWWGSIRSRGGVGKVSHGDSIESADFEKRASHYEDLETSGKSLSHGNGKKAILRYGPDVRVARKDTRKVPQQRIDGKRKFK